MKIRKWLEWLDRAESIRAPKDRMYLFKTVTKFTGRPWSTWFTFPFLPYFWISTGVKDGEDLYELLIFVSGE